MEKQVALIGLGIAFTGLIWLVAIALRPLPRTENPCSVERTAVWIVGTLLFIGIGIVISSPVIAPWFNR